MSGVDLSGPSGEEISAAVEEQLRRPTEEQFRATGYTADAVNYPLSTPAYEAKCAFNGIDPLAAPNTWRYAPNAYMRDFWEERARGN